MSTPVISALVTSALTNSCAALAQAIFSTLRRASAGSTVAETDRGFSSISRYLRKFDIIKSHDRDIARHGKPHIKRLGYSTNSQYVIAANDCSRFANSPKQRLKSLGTAF